MPSQDLRARYSNALIERIEVCQYPSKQLMDRFEATVGDRDHAAKYADILFDKITKYPSLQLLDRLAGLVSRIEWADRLAAQQDEQEG